eukprot:7624979-Pyramimonas_sp.AAC.1
MGLGGGQDGAQDRDARGGVQRCTGTLEEVCNMTSFYGSSCANHGKGALNTAGGRLYTAVEFNAPDPRVHSTPQKEACVP